VETETMTKYFCDQCGKEMPTAENKRLTGSHGHLGFEIITSQNGVANGGLYCHACIREAVHVSGVGASNG
jgi:hypothetical protein